jgi:hypothetical protein
MEPTAGKTAPHTEANFLTGISAGMEPTDGQVGRPILANGYKVQCMDRGQCCGLTARATKAPLTMTRNMAMECFPGQMGNSTTETGSTTNKKGRDFTSQRKESVV